MECAIRQIQVHVQRDHERNKDYINHDMGVIRDNLFPRLTQITPQITEVIKVSNSKHFK